MNAWQKIRNVRNQKKQNKKNDSRAMISRKKIE